MLRTDDETLFRLASGAAAVAAALAVRWALSGGYERATGSPPPRNPAAPRVTWTQALVWSAVAGAAVGLARAAALRAATAGWDRWAPRRAPVES